MDISKLPIKTLAFDGSFFCKSFDIENAVIISVGSISDSHKLDLIEIAALNSFSLHLNLSVINEAY